MKISNIFTVILFMPFFLNYYVNTTDTSNKYTEFSNNTKIADTLIFLKETKKVFKTPESVKFDAEKMFFTFLTLTEIRRKKTATVLSQKRTKAEKLLI